MAPKVPVCERLPENCTRVVLQWNDQRFAVLREGFSCVYARFATLRWSSTMRGAASWWIHGLRKRVQACWRQALGPRTTSIALRWWTCRVRRGEVLTGVDAVVVTHVHPDHFEEKTAALMDHALPVYAQNEADAATIANWGFSDVRSTPPVGLWAIGQSGDPCAGGPRDRAAAATGARPRACRCNGPCRAGRCRLP